jgi:hypothetical protein
MFQGWDSFFLLIGGACGALIGLLFVVASLPTGLERQNRMRGASLYMSPTVFHFAVVLVISGVALAPRLSVLETGAVLGLCGAVGAIHLGYVSWAIGSPKTPDPPHWSDVWCYGVAPLVLYAGLAAAGASTLSRQPWAAEAVAGLAMLLLLIAVRNAWDLVTWLAPAANGAAGANDTPAASQ